MKARLLTRRALQFVALVGLLVAAFAGGAGATHVFSDVPDNHPHAPGIEFAHQNGIVRGFADGTFRPNDNILRGQAASMFRSFDALMRQRISEVEGEPGPQGPAGPQGATGPTGATGPAGFSALDAVPSGQTIYGVIGGDFDSHTTSPVDWGTMASFPMRAPSAVTDATVTVDIENWDDIDGTQTAPLTSDEATEGGNPCTWDIASATLPTAPAGRVCIYVIHSDRADNIRGFGFGRLGIKMNWDSADTGDTFVDAVWAYTAP